MAGGRGSESLGVSPRAPATGHAVAEYGYMAIWLYLFLSLSTFMRRLAVWLPHATFSHLSRHSMSKPILSISLTLKLYNEVITLWRWLRYAIVTQTLCLGWKPYSHAARSLLLPYALLLYGFQPKHLLSIAVLLSMRAQKNGVDRSQPHLFYNNPVTVL
jgi:hypothetical protein